MSSIGKVAAAGAVALVGWSMIYLARRGRATRSGFWSRPDLADLARDDALRAIAEEDARSLADEEAPPSEVPPYLEAAPGGLGPSEEERYDAVPVDDLASEWLLRAVQSGQSKP